MATAPTSATIRTYHVGFGDCFLLSFQYGRKSERHVLIDFGSTGFPKGVPKSRMMDIAKDIKARTGGKLPSSRRTGTVTISPDLQRTKLAKQQAMSSNRLSRIS